MTPIFFGEVTNGKLLLSEKDMFAQHIYSLEGKKIQMIVEVKKKKRTSGKDNEDSNANGWYWSCIIPISAKELGYSQDEMHETFTQLYSPKEMNKIGDIEIPVPMRPSSMNTLQFAEYCDTIRMKMAEMNIHIPDPKKVKT